MGTRIAFLGLGRMGRELATHLVRDGHDVTVWNRTASKAQSLVDMGATLAANPGEAVDGATVVVTALFGPAAVQEVVIDAGLAIGAGALWMDVTTVSPDDATAYARWAEARGVRFASTPVIGTIAPARARTLGTAVGSPDPSTRAQAREVARSWSSEEAGGWIREYPTPGGAEVAKLIANVGIATATEGIREALRIGHGGGLTTEQVIDALQGSMLEKQVNAKRALILEGGFSETAFSANLLAKDIRLMLGVADGALPSATAFLDALTTVQRTGDGEDDFTAALRHDV